MTINHGLFGFPIRSYKYAAIFTLYFEIPPLVRLHRPVYGRIHCIQNIMEITMPTRVYLHTNLVPRKCDRRISYITYRSITLCDIITTCKVVNNVVIARVLPDKGASVISFIISMFLVNNSCGVYVPHNFSRLPVWTLMYSYFLHPKAISTFAPNFFLWRAKNL